MFSCLQINWQPFYLPQLLKFHPFEWLIEIYLQTESQGTHHKMVSLQPMPGFPPLFSLDRFSQESFSYQFGSVEIRTSLFVDDISDPNNCKTTATLSNKVLEDIQHQKRVTFSAEKRELLLVNRKDCGSLPLNSDKINSVQRARYLSDLLNEKGNYLDLCEDRADRAKTTITELCALSKGINFRHKQIKSLVRLYKSVFVPRFIYNCEAWPGLTIKEINV